MQHFDLSKHAIETITLGQIYEKLNTIGYRQIINDAIDNPLATTTLKFYFDYGLVSRMYIYDDSSLYIFYPLEKYAPECPFLQIIQVPQKGLPERKIVKTQMWEKKVAHIWMNYNEGIGHANLSRLFVAPEYRGRGIAQKLLKMVRQQSILQGNDSISVCDTSEGFDNPSHNIYLKCDYVIDQESNQWMTEQQRKHNPNCQPYDRFKILNFP